MDPSKTRIILGPPGTGKSTSLLTIIEDALTKGTPPNKIGFISFTKKAAEEGKSRASEKFNISPEDLPHFRTIHSLAFKHVGMRRDQVLNWTHIRELGKMLGLEFKGRGEILDGDTYGMNIADRMLFLEGLARNKKEPLQKAWNDAFEDSIDFFELDRFAKTLTSFKRNRSLYDFTDMLELFNSSDPASMPSLDLLAIDEAQDLSDLQWDAANLLSVNAKKVIVAGDDCQAIYNWSGANVERFIGLQGEQVTLDQSYRIPSSVHKLADSISNRISSKRSRSWRARPEIGAVNFFSGIEEVDLSQGSWLLLSRNGYMLAELEDYCLSQGFSFNSVSRDPLKSPALAAIKTWENLRKGRDESAERVLDCLKYGGQGLVPTSLARKLKFDDSGRMYGMPELVAMGLTSSEIWHVALSKISPVERDYFIAARKRGEKLLGKPRISISTIHASKGSEAENVLLLTDISYRSFTNMEKNYDDECRVFYVAVTRCKQTLNVIMPRTNLSFDL